MHNFSAAFNFNSIVLLYHSLTIKKKREGRRKYQSKEGSSVRKAFPYYLLDTLLSNKKAHKEAININKRKTS